MRRLLTAATVLLIVMSVTSCKEKKQIPQGFYQTQQEAQKEADRRNAANEKQRQELLRQGKADEAKLICEKAIVYYDQSQALWALAQDRSGCPRF